MRLALLGIMVTAAIGAIVALGDTLFPSATLADGFAADMNPAAHFLIRLRVWHPAIAVIVSFALVTVIVRSDALEEPALKTPARAVIGFVLLQVALGAANLFMLAPLALQMAHLLVSNLLWVAAVWTALIIRALTLREPL
jgi:heme A synthase